MDDMTMTAQEIYHRVLAIMDMVALGERGDHYALAIAADDLQELALAIPIADTPFDMNDATHYDGIDS